MGEQSSRGVRRVGEPMKPRIRFAATALGAASLAAGAQVMPPPQNVLQLTATSTTEVPQDLLSVTLAVQRDGADAPAVQSQLRQVLDAALAEARKAARPGQLDVRTGAFSLFPRYLPTGGIGGWQGRAELVLEGRDVAAISQLAGRLPGMVVAGVGHGLSREARERVESDVASQAIARFIARADAYAKQFGFGAWAIREVTVGQSDAPAPVPMPRVAMAAQRAGIADESLPVEAGRTTVSVTVNGSVQMTAR
jgi:predicted secreted protein